MRNIYLGFFCFIFTIGILLIPGYRNAFAGAQNITADTSNIIKATISTKITDTRLNKPAVLKNGVMVNFVPFKPGKNKLMGVPGTPASRMAAGNKILANVKVYPNPVSTQLNLSFSINKASNVTVKIMDILGNEMTTLLSEYFDTGDDPYIVSFDIASRLNSGFYFIRVSVGSEIVTKRISIL